MCGVTQVWYKYIIEREKERERERDQPLDLRMDSLLTEHIPILYGV